MHLGPLDPKIIGAGLCMKHASPLGVSALEQGHGLDDRRVDLTSALNAPSSLG